MTTTLDITSDPICPWCYIGKSYLDRALAQAPDHPFEIRWRPFQLNPDMPAEGMDRRAYLEGKFGGPEGAASVYGRIEETAKQAGLDIDFAAIKRTPNTIDAHRLIHWAGIEGRQPAVVAQLFRRYFREGQDISDHGVLTDVAEAVGMNAEATARLLSGEADRDEVRRADQMARDMGVQGVPTFIIGAHYALSGAQPPELWGQVIAEITEKTRAMADTAARETPGGLPN
ncbi:DsbA family oxidoreductase [Oceanomicrobium pacificus]|uniref:Thioredoxin domain-containing protein n=1 Tax=Oceanomicrobium pacificus TaxID=2692916 RepID=A0A6B0TMP2_9RHOB|nr:DsbA family oxidoreductase [Oceanomicrobium pacificus]MXU65850.1 thioredoxin domain-containing protein [Oceanomicrobium pacificus]